MLDPKVLAAMPVDTVCDLLKVAFKQQAWDNVKVFLNELRSRASYGEFPDHGPGWKGEQGK